MAAGITSATGDEVFTSTPASRQLVAISPFFFSSRRRHTTSLRDWSSDVCSSDLDGPLAVLLPVLLEVRVTNLEREDDAFRIELRRAPLGWDQLVERDRKSVV